MCAANFYYSTDQIKKCEMGDECVGGWFHTASWLENLTDRPNGRCSYRWVSNVTMDLQQVLQEIWKGFFLGLCGLG
jgi:hypothetical protein